jgi:hypothetical protein
MPKRSLAAWIRVDRKSPAQGQTDAIDPSRKFSVACFLHSLSGHSGLWRAVPAQASPPPGPLLFAED